MTVILYPTDPRQEAGFYRFLFAALRRHAGARLASGPRPLPRLEQPRQDFAAARLAHGDPLEGRPRPLVRFRRTIRRPRDGQAVPSQWR